MLLLAGGLTGFKKCTSTCIQTFAVASLISITWLMFGYSLAFGHNWDGTKNEFIGGANMFWFWGDGKGIPSFPACQPAKSSFACQSVTLDYRLSSIADGALRHAYAVSHQLELRVVNAVCVHHVHHLRPIHNLACENRHYQIEAQFPARHHPNKRPHHVRLLVALDRRLRCDVASSASSVN